jgi:hypothetical protein
MMLAEVDVVMPSVKNGARPFETLALVTSESPVSEI